MLHWSKFCSVSSPVEDTVDFPCEDSESSAVEERKEVNCKPPCFVNSYWFNALCSKLQCYSKMSGNQTADQYHMEDNSLNSKAGTSFYWSRSANWPKWMEIAPNVGHHTQKCGTFESKVRQNALICAPGKTLVQILGGVVWCAIHSCRPLDKSA